MKKLVIALCAMVFINPLTTVALTKKEVAGWTLSCALGTGALVYAINCPNGGRVLSFKNEETKEYASFFKIQPKNLPAAKMGALASGVSIPFFGWFFSHFTPSDRYQRAQKKVRFFERIYLFNQMVSQDNIAEVLQASGCESHEIPLVVAFLYFQKWDIELTGLLNSLDQAIDDLGYKGGLVRRIRDLQNIIHRHLKRIRENEAIIKQQSQWIEQWKLHLEQIKIKQQELQTHIMWHVN